MSEFDETNDNDVSVESAEPTEVTDCQDNGLGDDLFEQQSVETGDDEEAPLERVDEVEEQQDVVAEEEPNISDYKAAVQLVGAPADQQLIADGFCSIISEGAETAAL